jgi:hypothetical protein
MRRYVSCTLIAAFLLVVASVTEAAAQADSHRWSVQLSAGMVFPIGKFANTTNPGFGFAGTLGYSISSRWTLLGAFNGGSLKGEPSPDWNVYSYLIKAAFDTGEEGAKWRIMVPLGAGAVTFVPQSEAIPSYTYPAVNTGLMFQYHFNPRIAVTLDALATLALTSQNDLGTDFVWLFPFAAGFLVRF